MQEIEQLELAIKKLSTINPVWKLPPLEKSLLLWGSRVYRWTQDTMALLEKQLNWLDKNQNSIQYKQRFGEWENLLRLYERGCNALIAAQKIAPIQKVV